MRTRNQSGRFVCENEQTIGRKFGRLVITSDLGYDSFPCGVKIRKVGCVCVCGKKTTVLLPNLKRGITKSCGCLKKEKARITPRTHGMTGHPAYITRNGMVARCTNPKHEHFRNYGGRGIKVCRRWLESFHNFWEDMGSTWKPGLELDRRNNNGDYRKANCRWVTHKKNCNNR